MAAADATIVVFALLADGDSVPADDGFAAFVVDIVVCRGRVQKCCSVFVRWLVVIISKLVIIYFNLIFKCSRTNMNLK